MNKDELKKIKEEINPPKKEKAELLDALLQGLSDKLTSHQKESEEKIQTHSVILRGEIQKTLGLIHEHKRALEGHRGSTRIELDGVYSSLKRIEKSLNRFDVIDQIISGIKEGYTKGDSDLGEELKNLSQAIEKQVKELSESISTGRAEDLGVADKKHSILSKEIESLRDGDLVLSKQIVDNVTLLEAELKKLSKEIYSFGSQVQILSGGAFIGQTGQLNFKAGTNTTVSVTANAQGGIDIAFNATSGGFTTLAATETPNGSRTTFTFASAIAKPSFIIADNAMMQATSAAGDINWTWNNSTKVATLTVPPNSDIIAIK